MDSKMEAANTCILANSKQAAAISFVPLVSVPLVHGICVKMIVQLNKIFGISTDTRFGSEIFNNVLAGVVMAPVMALPLLGAGMSYVYIKSIGEDYATAVAAVLSSVEKEKDAGSACCVDIEDECLIADRIKLELQSMYKYRRTRRGEHSFRSLEL